MKIVYTPNLIVRELTPEQRKRILAAEPRAAIVEAKGADRQRAEIADADILFGRVPPDIYPLARRLKLYQSIGAGVDSALCPELVNDDVPLSSEKGGVGVHLAEHAFGLLLTLSRGIHTAIRTPDYGLRESIRTDQRELYELTMGIVGFGGVGRDVAKRAVGFGMRVLGVDIEDVAPEPGVEAIWKPERMRDMLGQADVVVIGLPLTKATRHLFTRDLFRKMKKTAILVNAARGPIVDEAALVKALKEGWIAAAGLDVFEEEPKIHPGLLSLANVTLAPHIASASLDTRLAMANLAVRNCLAVLEGKPAITPVSS